MRRLGISVYPGHASLGDNLAYIDLAGSYGFKRVFTCLISADTSNIDDFKQVATRAKAYDMEVIADVSPEVFEKLGVSIHDLKAFSDLGLDGIRLDLGFSGNEESIMSCNPYGLKIELNMSNGTRYLENILSYQPVKANIYGCHNFYPHRYTGLDYDHFIMCSDQFKSLGIKTAAFVNSSHAHFGPWPVDEGLCTLEEHRDLNIVTQAKALFNTGLIDDVIVANCFASEEELKALSEMNKEVLELTVELFDDISDIEKTIVLNEPHFNRGDVSSYMIRSTQSRVKYKNEEFPPKHTDDMTKGDILIDSSLYKRYAGELQLAKLPMKNSGKTSRVGRVIEEELFLIDTIKPWQKFKFVLKEG